MNANTPFELPGHGEFLPTRILPGPMEGVTEGEFLKILTRHQWIRSWWTPFLRISVAVPRVARLRDWLAQYAATRLPILTQLMGTDATRIAKAASALRKLGARGIDLNCACPSQIVVGNGAGGARLRSPEWIAETITAIKSAMDCPVGVKVRMGFDSPKEFHDRIAPALREAKPDFVTVHFRTVQELYRPISDGLERLKHARKELQDIPLIGSGDLFTPEDAVNMFQKCGVDAIAPARGLLKNPRLILDIEQRLNGESPAPWTTQEKYALLQEFETEGTHLGFLLQMAANLFGRESQEFKDIVQKQTRQHSQ